MPEFLSLILIGVLAGFVSGMVGVGGGVVMVPALILVLGYSQHMAQGTTLGMMLPPIGILAVMNYWQQGYVNIKVAGFLIVGFVVGAFFGSKLAVSLPEDILKKVFGVFMALVAIKLIFTK